MGATPDVFRKGPANQRSDQIDPGGTAVGRERAPLKARAT